MKIVILLIALLIPAHSAQSESALAGVSGQMFTSKKVAREIMGKNYFGVEDAIKYFKVNPSKEEIAGLSEVPFSESTLKECAQTHILVAVFPLSILEIQDRVDNELFNRGFGRYSYWHNNQKFAKDREEASWYLVRKTEFPNSTDKNWSEQVTLLGKNEDASSFDVEFNSTANSGGAQQSTIGKNEEVPSARIMVYTVIGHYLATGEHLLKKIYVRCADVNSDGLRLHIGAFGLNGLSVSHEHEVYDENSRRYGGLGLASVRRKFQ